MAKLKDLLTLEKAREKFPVDSQPALRALREYIKSKRLKAVKIGKRYYTTEAWIERFILGDDADQEDAGDATDKACDAAGI